MENKIDNLVIKRSRLKSFNWILIILTLILSSVFVGFRAYFTEPEGDDIVYRYMLSNGHVDPDIDYPIKTISDALESQKHEYFNSNGRVLIHTLVHMFVGPWRGLSYILFLSVIFPNIIILFIIYTIPKTKRGNPLIWIFAVIFFLYLFRNNSMSWYGVALGMNYLFPMLPVLAWLLVYKKHGASLNVNYGMIICFILLGLITGLSQECYSVPLSGGVFFYLIINKNRFKFTAAKISLIISLWIGTAILVLAPGNFDRMAASLQYRIMMGILFTLSTITLWILVLDVILLRIKNKERMLSFLKDNSLNFLILIVGILFGLVANTRARSFNGVVFYSVILIFLSLRYYSFIFKISRLYEAVALFLLIAFTFHQSAIVSAAKRNQKVQQAFLTEYRNTDKNILRQPNLRESSLVKPYLLSWFGNPSFDWSLDMFGRAFKKTDRQVTLLDSLDYSYFIKNKSELHFGKMEFVVGEKYIWLPDDKVDGATAINVVGKSLPEQKDVLYDAIKLFRILYPSKGTNFKIEINDNNVLRGQNGIIGIKKGNSEITQIEIAK